MAHHVFVDVFVKFSLNAKMLILIPLNPDSASYMV